jgi:multisubunit Na+/H+ antiporter MnhB subunit
VKEEHNGYKNIIRFVVAILASWVAMWLGHNRLPEPLTQGLAFGIMFLLLPLTLSDKPTDKKPSIARHFWAAAAGGAVVFILNILFGGWQGK